MSNLDTILAFLQGKGLSSAQAAGVAGNLQVESGFSPTASNPREGAVGIAQWEGGRRTALDNYARATGGSETDLNTQLGYLWQELQGPESNALHRLLATNDPGNAAAVFDQFYERSSGAARGTRVADAQAIAAGRPTTTGSATAGAGGGSTTAGAQQASWLGSALGAPSWSDVLSGLLKLTGVVIAGALVVEGAKTTVRGPQ